MALEEFENAVAISALKGYGMDKLLEAIHQKLYESFMSIKVKLPFREGALIALFHEKGQVEVIEHERDGVYIEGRLPGRLIARYRPFEADEELEVAVEEQE
jgi:GTP-binding protein HflX